MTPSPTSTTAVRLAVQYPSMEEGYVARDVDGHQLGARSDLASKVQDGSRPGAGDPAWGFSDDENPMPRVYHSGRLYSAGVARCRSCGKTLVNAVLLPPEWLERYEMRPCRGRPRTEGHGTRACYLRGCPRPECEQACKDYNRQTHQLRRRLRGPQPHHLTDARPAREHLRSLIRAGVSIEAISAESGVPVGTITTVLYRAARVKRATEQALLACSPRPSRVKGQARSALALATFVAEKTGMTMTEVGDAAGVGRGTMTRIRRGQKVLRVETIQKLRALAERVASEVQPSSPWADRRAS